MLQSFYHLNIHNIIECLIQKFFFLEIFKVINNHIFYNILKKILEVNLRNSNKNLYFFLQR